MKASVSLLVVTFGTVIFLAAAMLNQIQIPSSEAAGGPTVYGQFSGNANGVVEIISFGSGIGSQVTARVNRPGSGLVAFCLTRADGSRVCSTVNSSAASFDRSTKGCTSFVMTMNSAEMPTRVEIFDQNFITSLAAADLTEETPNNLGKLNPCRH